MRKPDYAVIDGKITVNIVSLQISIGTNDKGEYVETATILDDNNGIFTVPIGRIELCEN